MKSLKINRTRWLHDEGTGNSFLHREYDRKMCCLGFYLHSCGLKVADISEYKSPQDINGKIPTDARWLLHISTDSTICGRLMEVNDYIDNDYTLTRESKIKELFKEHDVDVVFTGKYPEPMDN